MLNPRFDDLIPSPFERLVAVLDGIAPPADIAPISLALVDEPDTIDEALERMRRVLN